MEDPGRVPSADEAASRLASFAVVIEVFTRLDAKDIDSALELYADDATFLQAQGKEAIKDTMVRGMAPNADKRSRHVITNLRASRVDHVDIAVEYTAVAFTLDGPGPYAARAVFDQRQVHRLEADGRLRVVDHQILGFEPVR
jgi:ketosteroid isomerase-like protein